MVNKNYESQYDVFNSFLVRNANYCGLEEFPTINSCNEIPNKIITFSEAMRTNDYNQWVCFYELDYLFIRVWNNPKKYLNKLKKFKGVISPDFSLYVNMPIVLQKYHTYMGRALANWFIENGIKVIPNVRTGDARTYSFAFDGLNKNEIISIGTIGTCRKKIERKIITDGIKETIKELQPKGIIIYGSLPKEINEEFANVKFYIYESNNFKKIGEKQNG
jgi:hypothetical protein